MAEDIENTRDANYILRQQRELRGWSRKRLALEIHQRFPGVAVTEKEVARWENGKRKPGPYYREKLCVIFNMRADELGLMDSGPVATTPTLPSGRQVVTLTSEQVAMLYPILLGDPTMKTDKSRRDLLLHLLGATGFTLTMPTQELFNPEPWERLARSVHHSAQVNEEALGHFAQLVETCWGLSNASQPDTVQLMLPNFLPKIERLVSDPIHQKMAAGIAAQGYMLAAEVDKKNVPALERYCELAVEYSMLTNVYSIQVAALKQQATIALIAKKRERALESYQRALPLVRYVSPLLRSRIYMGLASAYARYGGHDQDALRYIGLAHEAFPDKPETDPSYSYTVCTESVLHLYDGLTYMDLEQPQQAWDALALVEGLHPKMHVAESWRIEIINLQASAAAELGEMEKSCSYVEAGAKAASAQGYDIWSSESADVYQQIHNRWPREARVKDLADLFHKV